jgi:para-nitrobenzyl esterase
MLARETLRTAESGKHAVCFVTPLPANSRLQSIAMDHAFRYAALAFTIVGLGACSSSSSGTQPSEMDAGVTDTGSPSTEAGISEAAASSLDVPTDKGMVHGARAGGVRSFLGIPFAASTGGANRWKPPQPVAAWTTPFKATALGPICPQIDPSTMKYATTGSEDCLSLNVWTPDPAPTTPVPVMVWIYGGAFVFGSSGAAPYSGDHLVPKGNVVVVSMNYRVGTLGFYVHSGLAAEDPNHVSGNYGLLDQQAALKWVQTNIGAFGGDKTKVTLFGESAGGKSTCLHLLSPGSRGLFNAAIVESGYYSLPGLTLTQAESQGDMYATAMGCTDSTTALSCLRAKSPTDIVNGPTTVPTPLPGGIFYQDDSTSLTFQPIVDGMFLPEEPAAMFAEGKQAPVPVLQGANTAEGVLFHFAALGAYTPVATTADYLGALTRRFGTNANAVAAHYPASGTTSGADGGTGADAGNAVSDAGGDSAALPLPNDALTQVTADAFFVCPARKLARLLAAGTSKTYLYSFNGTLTGVPLAQLANLAFHSAELPYVFGDKYLLGSVPTANQPLVDAIEGYWTAFAKSVGDPNGGSNPMWPAYTMAADQYQDLDTTVTTATGLEKANCDFWDSLPSTTP